MMCQNCHKSDTEKQDADEKELAKFAEKMITQMTKLKNSQMNLSVQAVEKDTWQELTTVNLKQKKGLLKKYNLVAE